MCSAGMDIPNDALSLVLKAILGDLETLTVKESLIVSVTEVVEELPVLDAAHAAAVGCSHLHQLIFNNRKLGMQEPPVR